MVLLGAETPVQPLVDFTSTTLLAAPFSGHLAYISMQQRLFIISMISHADHGLSLWQKRQSIHHHLSINLEKHLHAIKPLHLEPHYDSKPGWQSSTVSHCTGQRIHLLAGYASSFFDRRPYTHLGPGLATFHDQTSGFPIFLGDGRCQDFSQNLRLACLADYWHHIFVQQRNSGGQISRAAEIRSSTLQSFTLVLFSPRRQRLPNFTQSDLDL